MSFTHIPAALRRQVRERAGNHCECFPEEFAFRSHQVDHIVAEKHGGHTSAANLALSCLRCNLAKGTDLTSIDPETGKIAKLFHPRKERWEKHFAVSGSLIHPLTATGRVTARLLHFNLPDRVQEREAAVLLAEMEDGE